MVTLVDIASVNYTYICILYEPYTNITINVYYSYWHFLNLFQESDKATNLSLLIF